MRFAEKLERFTREKNKAKIARAAGLPANAINEYIAKGYTPRADNALALAKALKVPLEWLVDDSRDYPPPEPVPKPTVSDLPDYDLLLELARRFRREQIETLDALASAEHIIESKSFDATPAELRRILQGVFAANRRIPPDFTPFQFAQENHAAMPGSERPRDDFDIERIKARVAGVLANEGFRRAMATTLQEMPPGFFFGRIPADFLRLWNEFKPGPNPFGLPDDYVSRLASVPFLSEIRPASALSASPSNPPQIVFKSTSHSRKTHPQTPTHPPKHPQ
jgi:transcriptional regulator with XRE-family HTH domain